MKKSLHLLLAATLLLTLSACAGKTVTDVRVKCPACGYEFDVDSKG